MLAGRGFKSWSGIAIVTIAAGALYFSTAARDIVVGDTPELITAAATLGIAHPPGYPLFTMLGHLFSLIPLGSIPFRVNALSVVCDSLAVGIIYLAAVRLTRSHIAAAVAALALAVDPIFWEWSLEAEVFPLNNVLAAILVLLVVIWNEQRTRLGVLVAACFVAGLALTNHQTIVLLAPALFFVMWLRRAVLFEHPRVLLLSIVAFAAELTPYAYILWAAAHHPVYNWGNVSSVHDLIGLITRRSYGATRLVNTPGYTGGPPWPRLAAFFGSFSLFNGILICVGALELFRTRRWYFWFTAIGFVFIGPFFIWITNLNVASAPSALFVLQRFFLLSHVFVAPLVAFGVLLIAKWMAGLWPRMSIFSLRVTATICAIAIAATVLLHYRALDQRRNFIARQFGDDVFAAAKPDSILLVSGDGFAFPLLYLQKVEHVRPDVTVIALPTLLGEWYARQLREQHPDLVIPFDRYDRAANNVRMLVEANPGRTVALAGTLGDDHSLDDNYWPYQQGVLTVVMPKAREVSLATMLSENEALFSRCHPPASGAARMNTFEADIVSIYTFSLLRLGEACERGGLKDPARAWYERALAINPQFSKAREALKRLAE